MGDPKFPTKSYQTPSHPWRGDRIKAETGTCVQYGLKNKHELWKAQSVLRNLRNQSKNLQARVRVNDQQAKLEAELLLKKCAKLGLLPVEGSTLDDVLGLTENAMLDRRLQTMVLRKGLASTARQARQFIVHGHVSIDGRKVTIPGYIVNRGEEDKISFNARSPIANEMHPVRMAASDAKSEKTKEVERVAKERETKNGLKVDPKVLKRVAPDVNVAEAVETVPADLPDVPEEPARKED